MCATAFWPLVVLQERTWAMRKELQGQICYPYSSKTEMGRRPKSWENHRVWWFPYISWLHSVVTTFTSLETPLIYTDGSDSWISATCFVFCLQFELQVNPLFPSSVCILVPVAHLFASGNLGRILHKSSWRKYTWNASGCSSCFKVGESSHLRRPQTNSNLKAHSIIFTILCQCALLSGKWETDDMFNSGIALGSSISFFDGRFLFQNKEDLTYETLAKNIILSSKQFSTTLC